MNSFSKPTTSSAIWLCLVIIAIIFNGYSYAEIAPVDPEVEKHNVETNDRSKLEIHDTGELDTKTKNEPSNSYMGASGSFVHGFIATLSVIVVSELGDKTFFIAAIMAMRHPRWTVFIGAIAALSVMHVMSAFFGYAITIIPRTLTYYVSSLLFAIFGIKMLREGWKMSPNVSSLATIFQSIINLRKRFSISSSFRKISNSREIRKYVVLRANIFITLFS